jgi:hypothetical protein
MITLRQITTAAPLQFSKSMADLLRGNIYIIPTLVFSSFHQQPPFFPPAKTDHSSHIPTDPYIWHPQLSACCKHISFSFQTDEHPFY